MEWTRLRSGWSHGRRHAIAPDGDVTDDGAPALCGRWLSVIDDPPTMWDPKAGQSCLVCKEKQRQAIETINW